LGDFEHHDAYSTLSRGSLYGYAPKISNQVHRCVPVASCYEFVVNNKRRNSIADISDSRLLGMVMYSATKCNTTAKNEL